MGGFSVWHWAVVLAVVLLLFGGGKISVLMGDFAKGIKTFKKNIADQDDLSLQGNGERPASLLGSVGKSTDGDSQRKPTTAL